MMDLIDRKMAIEAIKQLLLEPDSVQYIWSSDALNAVSNEPSVTAVPLDKLCEWLEDNAALTYGAHISAHGWKRELTMWMEGLDGTD